MGNDRDTSLQSSKSLALVPPGPTRVVDARSGAVVDVPWRDVRVGDLVVVRNREVAPAVETDHVTVRRLLVDWGHLERTADGRRYRVGFPPGGVAFDLEVEDVDPVATVAAYRDQVARRPRRRPPASGSD